MVQMKLYCKLPESIGCQVGTIERIERISGDGNWPREVTKIVVGSGVQVEGLINLVCLPSGPESAHRLNGAYPR